MALEFDMNLTVKVDTRQVSRMLTDLQKKQLPYATSLALNDVSFTTQAAEKASFKSFFKHPRPFTANSIQVDKAKKTNLSATIFIRPEVATYLAPYEFGGAHVVPGKLQLIPIKLRLDQYGQATQTTIKKLNEQANDPKSGIFFAEIHGVKGYWLRVKPPPVATTRRGKPIFGPFKPPQRIKLIAEVEAPKPVTEHLDFIQNATYQVQRAWPDAIQRAMAKALASAK